VRIKKIIRRVRSVAHAEANKLLTWGEYRNHREQSPLHGTRGSHEPDKNSQSNHTSMNKGD